MVCLPSCFLSLRVKDEIKGYRYNTIKLHLYLYVYFLSVISQINTKNISRHSKYPWHWSVRIGCQRAMVSNLILNITAMVMKWHYLVPIIFIVALDKDKLYLVNLQKRWCLSKIVTLKIYIIFMVMYQNLYRTVIFIFTIQIRLSFSHLLYFNIIFTKQLHLTYKNYIIVIGHNSTSF